jgi:hypothetical protein
VPGIGLDEVRAGAGWVGLESARAEQDADAFGAEGVDTVAEGLAAG